MSQTPSISCRASETLYDRNVPLVAWAKFQEHIVHLTTEEQQRIGQAFSMAKDAYVSSLHTPEESWHWEETRWQQGERGFAHHAATAALLADMHADEASVVAALLYGAVDEGLLEFTNVQTAFGTESATLINELVSVHEADLEDRPSLNPRLETLRKRCMLMQEDIRIMVITLADRFVSLRAVYALDDWKRQQTFVQETMDVYSQIAGRMSLNDLRNEIDALCLSLLKPDLFEQLSALRERMHTHADACVLPRMQEAFTACCGTLPCELQHEDCPWSQLQTWLETQPPDSSSLPPLHVALVCNTSEDCYAVLGILHQIWQLDSAAAFRDSINTPEVNGEQGIHTAVILPDGTHVRCRICTQDMQEYAHGGIATLCFKEEVVGLQEYIPWLKHISLLSDTTADASQEFLQFLKSDILSDQIVIHGQDDTTIFLPQGATALDGALLTAGENALWMESLSVNGKEFQPKSPLPHGASLSVHAGTQRTVNRKWLQWVRTGTARGMIQAALSKAAEPKKIAAGMQLLQQIMRKKGKGFLEEFNTSEFGELLEPLDFASLDEACIAIADGSIEAEKVYAALFEPRKDDAMKERPVVLSCHIDTSDAEAMSGLMHVYQKYQKRLSSFRIQQRLLFRRPSNARFSGMLSPVEQQVIIEELKATGVQKVLVAVQTVQWKYVLSIVALIVLWGLDPVIAKMLLTPPLAVNPIDFTIIRFATFFCLCLLGLGLANVHTKLPLQRLPWNDVFLWIAGCTLFLTALATYLSLTVLLPQEYITMTYATAVLFPSVQLVARAKIRKKHFLYTLLPIIVAFGMLKYLQPSMSWSGFGMGILVALAFLTLTICTDEYKRRNRIQARLPMFLFALSSIALLCTVFLLFVHGLPPLNATTSIVFLYAIIFTSLPYFLFYVVLMVKQWHMLAEHFILATLLTLGAQLSIFGVIHLPSLFPLAVICATTLLFYKTCGHFVKPEE